MRTGSRAAGAITALALAFAAVTDAGINPADAAAQFELRVDASRSREVQLQRGGRFELQAEMSVELQQPSVAPAPLAGGAYILDAVASTSSLVCYNDTIFRDDFDGDGF